MRGSGGGSGAKISHFSVPEFRVQKRPPFFYHVYSGADFGRGILGPRRAFFFFSALDFFGLLVVFFGVPRCCFLPSRSSFVFSVPRVALRSEAEAALLHLKVCSSAFSRGALAARVFIS